VATNTRLEERRAQHKRYKQDVESGGKPFFPYAVFHDTVMSLVTVLVIAGLACVWYFTSDEAAGEEGTGWLGPRYTEEADPGTTNFVPRPDWYFFFLFYLLRIFKWPESVVLGTVGVPTICLILLLALPFLDLRREKRLARRPVAVVAAILVVMSMGVLSYKGATAEESQGIQNNSVIVEWARVQGFSGNEVAIRGAELFSETGCMQCHVYLTAGAQNLGAPELTDAGASGKGVDYYTRWIANPQAIKPGNPMPKYAQLGRENLRALATFVDASKGPQDGG